MTRRKVVTDMRKIGGFYLPEYLVPHPILRLRVSQEVQQVEHYRFKVVTGERGPQVDMGHGVAFRRPWDRIVHVVALVAREPEDHGTDSTFYPVVWDSAVCSPDDNYSRRMGYTMAFKRALHFLTHQVPLGAVSSSERTVPDWTSWTFPGENPRRWRFTSMCLVGGGIVEDPRGVWKVVHKAIVAETGLPSIFQGVMSTPTDIIGDWEEAEAARTT